MKKPVPLIKPLAFFISSLMLCSSLTVTNKAMAGPKDRIAVGDSIAEAMTGVTYKSAKHSKNTAAVIGYAKSVPDDKARGATIFLSTGISNNAAVLHKPSQLAQIKKNILEQLKILHGKNAGLIMVAGVAEDFDTTNNKKSKRGTVSPIKKTNSKTPTEEGREINSFLAAVVSEARNQGIPVKFLGPIPAAKTYDDVHGDRTWYQSIKWETASAGPYASSSTPTSEPSSADPRIPNYTEYSDAQLQEIFNRTGRLPGVGPMQFAADFYNSCCRFGETRDGSSRAHTGIDMSRPGGLEGKGSPLIAGDSGKVVYIGEQFRAKSGGGHYITVQRDNGGRGLMPHYYRYLHMDAATTLSLQDRVAQGATVGKLGGSGRAGGYQTHLHLDYLVPPSQARSAWLKDLSGNYVVMGVNNRGGTGGERWSGSFGVYSDPTPYLSEDRVYTGQGYKAGVNPSYEKWLGNTYRRQFNLLYGTNLPQAPAGSKVKGHLVKDPTRKIPETVLTQIKQYYQEGKRLTPDELAAIRMSLTNAGVLADLAGYDLSGQYISQRILATAFLADDGRDFGTLPSGHLELKLTDQSPKELIETLGNTRYGNQEWSRAMSEVNSKGMLTEYLMMEAQENFIRHHNLMLRQRVEQMLSVVASGELVEYSKKIQTLAEMAKADVVPGMINLQIEQSGDEWFGGVPTSSNYVCSTNTGDAGGTAGATVVDREVLINKLLDDLTHAEAAPNGFNRGQACSGRVRNWSYPKGRADTPITSMTPQQLLDRYNTDRKSNYKSGNVDCSVRIFAVGAWQIVPETMNGLLRVFPEDRHKPFNIDMQRKFARYLLMQKPNFKKFMEGKGTLEAAQLDIAKVWASIAVPGTNRSYYGNGNKANAKSTSMLRANLAALGGCVAVPDGSSAVTPTATSGTSGSSSSTSATPTSTGGGSDLQTGNNSGQPSSYTDGKNNITVPLNCTAHPEALKAGVKYYPVADVNSSQLTTVGGKKVHKEMAPALQAMINDAKKDGVTLEVGSGHRGVSYQRGIIDRKKGQGLSARQIYVNSAPAGYSEHHSGFAVDFSPINSSFERTPAWRWLQNNASKYGFRLTYQKTANGKAINGTSFESWHWAWQGNLNARNALASSRCYYNGGKSN